MTADAAPRPDDRAFSDEEFEVARVLFARPAVFMMGAVSVAGLPEPDLPEVAFAGRSNVGKSSLINALVGQKHLARASNEPGRTRRSTSSWSMTACASWTCPAMAGRGPEGAR